MSKELCKWLHKILEDLPLVSFPFDLKKLPRNGIYFFYENGEAWNHNGNQPRIVKIGTHRDANFRSRIKEHFILDESKMNFNSEKPAPKDRSIFRKNLGRALLNKRKDKYLEIWNKDLIRRKNRKKFAHLRDIKKEKEIESKITKILRQNFSFRFILIDEQIHRMGEKGLERFLIGTVARCNSCVPSDNWLGKYSPKKPIRENGLWLIQHLKAREINEEEKQQIINAISTTKEWINDKNQGVSPQ